MSPAEWDPTLETGNALVDSQHRALVRLIGEVEQALGRDDETAVEEALFGLLRYVGIHFGEEEMLMAESGYPELDAHRALHHAFTHEVSAMTRAYFEGREGLPDEVCRVVHEWLVDHLMRHDRAMVEWVRAHPAR